MIHRLSTINQKLSIKSCGIKIPTPNPVLTLLLETGKKSLSLASKPLPASPPTVRTPSPKGSASTVRRLKETSPMDRRRDRTRWVEVLNCCTAWIPLRKDPHGPEAYGTSGSITLPQPKAARDHCTPAHRTSYQVGRVRLSPPASPQPTAMPKLRPRSQASREKPGLKAISQDFKQEALTLDKERKLRLLSHPRSGTARKDPKANAAMMALRSHHYENIDILQHPSEENLPQPGIAGPRVPRPDAAVPASPQSNLLRAVCSEQSEENRKRSAKA